MKKLITILGIITVLVMGIAIVIYAYKDVRKSVDKYISNDLVGESGDINESSQQKSELAGKQSVDVKDKTKKELVENITDDVESGESKEEAADTLSPNIIDGQTIQNELLNSESTEESVSKASVHGDEQNNQTTSEEITEEEATADTQTDDAVETALNITNPSIKIDATSAILIDDNNGNVLFYKNATEPIYPASTTKLMTALVALDICKLDDEVTIGGEINSIAEDSSRANLEEGQCLTLKMLLEGMLIPSGNDAAYAIAAYVGRVSLQDEEADNKSAIKEFVRLMNKKVEELGLNNTQFKTPDGYDAEGQITTAYDMGMIAVEALKNNTIKEICSKSQAENVFISGEAVTWYSSNKLIVSGSEEYYQYAIGLKTGSSSKAGKCLISAAKKGDSMCVSVVMNSSTIGRWEDSIALLKYGLKE